MAKLQKCELLLWRHAEAEEGENDFDRALTPRGHRQARQMADWLAAHCPRPSRILVSPTLRTRQTAEALGLPFDVVVDIGPDARAEDLLGAARWPDSGACVLLVGHQPVLGELASLLLAGQPADWSIRKGAVWWLSCRVRADMRQTLLRAAISPDLIESGGRK